MASAVMEPDIEYGLAEKAILSERLLSTSTLPDVLARPGVLTAAVEPAPAKLLRVAIRKRDSEVSGEVQATGASPRPFIKSIENIVTLLTLPPGWNSYSARPIAPQNAVRAIRLVWDLLQAGISPPFVAPRVRGGIQLEWHTERGDVEIYIDSPDQISFFAEHAESGATEAPLTGHEEVLRDLIQRVAGK